MSGFGQSKAHPESSGTGGMGFITDVKKSSKQQQNSQVVKDMLKAKSYISKPYVSVQNEVKQNMSNGTLAQPKPSANYQPLGVKFRDPRDDELVKYMSNLPGYLHRVDKAENVQDKALNVGVLDWGRLQNWKGNQRGVQVGIGYNASSSSSYLSTKVTPRLPSFFGSARNETRSSEGKLNPPPGRSSSSFSNGISRTVTPSFQEARLFQDVDKASENHLDVRKRGLWNYKSFGRSSSEAVLRKGKQRELDQKVTSKTEARSSNSSYNSMSIGPWESASSCDKETKKRSEQMQGSDMIKKALKQNTPTLEASSLGLRSSDPSFGMREKKNIDDRMKEMKLKEPAVDSPHQHQVDESKNIVLLLPVKNSMSNRVKLPRSIAENVKGATQNSLLDDLPDKKDFSSKLQCGIPPSCPLPSRASSRGSADTGQQDMTSDAINTQDVEPSVDAIGSARPSNENILETSRTLDQDTAELAARRGRHPSPTRRFSFSLGRMTRSLSFKEGSSVPQLSSSYVSVKSGPVTSADSANREKLSGHNRARSSPFRRILDPLLKPNASTRPNSVASDQSSRVNLDSCSFEAIQVPEMPQNEKCKSSSIRAHLMLTRNNGFPLFRFVINNKNIIVAAPMKNLTLPSKNDQGCNYVLYSIDEIKRKSGSWINQVGKEKSCGFVYNVVGQMKINGSISMDFRGSYSNAKESVLYGVERRQSGQVSADLKPNTELAAVVVKKPSGDLGCIRSGSNKETNFIGKGFEQQTNNCTVILPGGIHTLPSTGVPASLIHRWRSGGSCDCGGWDVGCQLRILSNENLDQKCQRASDSFLVSDHFELFVQGDTMQDKPIFSMATTEKGKYSVEYSPSISSLQAFFICVSVLSCQKLSDFDETNSVYEEKVPQEYGNANDGMKVHKTVAAPVKYTPSPPVSPVGRV